MGCNLIDYMLTFECLYVCRIEYQYDLSHRVFFVQTQITSLVILLMLLRGLGPFPARGELLWWLGKG